ncbi:MAG: asparagine synthetase B, partial [Christensenellaceae bacterium]|nr:asparagine synthetase B [Christensenellaceae bacterium]
IFAFAVLNETTNQLFIARDRIGVKPFFYYFDNGKFVFGSELATVLAHPAVPHIVDKRGILEIVLIGPGRTIGNGVFKNIYELPPASTATININNLCDNATPHKKINANNMNSIYDNTQHDNGNATPHKKINTNNTNNKGNSHKKINIKKYWRLVDKPYLKPYQAAVAEVRGRVTDAIERQLISDVPVGTFLSGGIDSSIISAVAKKHYENLQTFSVDYHDNSRYFRPTKFQPNDDQYYIKTMNDYLHTTGNKTVITTQKLVKSLYKAVDTRGLPAMADVDGSLLLFCGEIKRKVTVAISGECADEIFGGYPWYYDKTVREQNGFPWSQNVAYRAEFLKSEFTRNVDIKKFVNDKYKKTIADTDISATTEPVEQRMKQMMQLNMDWFMQTLLDRKDRMSMYNGLEVRVPFCDYRLVELAYNLPWHFKYRDGVEKCILRDAFADMLPNEILTRKKSPYPKTHNPEYLSAVTKILREIIADKTQPIHQIIKKRALQNLLDGDTNTPWYGQLMTQPQTIAYFIQMNYWLKKFEIVVK